MFQKHIPKVKFYSSGDDFYTSVDACDKYHVCRNYAQVHFRLGFLPNFETGTEEWTDSAELISVDRTNVKVLVSVVVW